MVLPIQYSLSQFLSNIITLVGGVVMCFVTSWRLSMLAFTTILPMMHITGVYATWSGEINKRRYQFLSDAQSRMGEAINNIRHPCPPPPAAPANPDVHHFSALYYTKLCYTILC